MVLCDLYLKRFDLTKGLLFDTFSITVWYRLCYYDHSVLRVQVQIIFTTNELVDRTRNFKSNATRFKQKKYGKNTMACVCLGGAIHIDAKPLLEDRTKLFVLPFSVGVLLFCQPIVRHQSMSNAFSLICCACTLSVCSPLLNVRACHLHADI